MSQAPAGHFRHRHAGRRDERGQHECRLVSDAAGTVFVHLDAVEQRTEIDLVSDFCISSVKYVRFFSVHASKINGHSPRRHLVVRDVSACESGDEMLDFTVTQRLAAPFL